LAKIYNMYIVIPDKIAQHENHDICVVQQYFFHEIFFVYLAHNTS